MSDEDWEADPLTISSWEIHAKYCIKSGKQQEFAKKLGNYIWIENWKIHKDLMAYAVGRMGDFAKEDLDEQIKRKKLAKEARCQKK